MCHHYDNSSHSGHSLCLPSTQTIIEGDIWTNSTRQSWLAWTGAGGTVTISLVDGFEFEPGMRPRICTTGKLQWRRISGVMHLRGRLIICRGISAWKLKSGRQSIKYFNARTGVGWTAKARLRTSYSHRIRQRIYMQLACPVLLYRLNGSSWFNN